MKLRTLVIVVAVLAVLSLGVYFLRRPAPPASADARLNQALVKSETAEQAAKLRISDQGKTVTLVRQPDNTWRVSTYHDLPADFSKLSRLVSDLTGAKIQRLVTSNPDRIARLEFKDTKIEFLDSADKPLASITLGKQAESGGGRFVRFDNESKAYLANLSAWIDAEAKNWANSQLLDLKADDIAKIEIPFAEDGPVTVSRARKEDPWTSEQTPENQQLKTDRINSVLTSLGSLRFSDTIEPTDPKVAEAKPHPRAFKLTTFGGKTYTVTLARKPEEKKLKPPSPDDGKSGPAALGSISDLAKKDEKADDVKGESSEETKPDTPLAPEFETIPAGPVYVTIASSDSDAPINALMQKRAFQIGEWTYTGLPQKREELFEPAPQSAATEPATSAEKESAESAR